MFALFILANTEKHSFIQISKYLIGNWTVKQVTYEGNSQTPNTTFFNVTFFSAQDLNSLELNSTNQEIGKYYLKFQGKGIFTLFDSNHLKVADFDFLTTLFPHLSSTGQFGTDYIYTSDFISQNSIRLQLFNQKTQGILIFYFSKPSYKKNVIQKNSLFLISIVFILLNRLIKVLQNFAISKFNQTQANSVKENDNTKENDDNKEDNEEEIHKHVD